MMTPLGGGPELVNENGHLRAALDIVDLASDVLGSEQDIAVIIAEYEGGYVDAAIPVHCTDPGDQGLTEKVIYFIPR